MSILEVIVLLIGTSVIGVLLYGAYQFWTEAPDSVANPQASKTKTIRKTRTVLPKADWPIEAVSGRRPS